MRNTTGFHEDFSREAEAAGPTDRTFGLTVGGVLMIIALVRMWRGNAALFTLVCACAGAALAVTGLAMPLVLRPLNRLWTKLGLLMMRVVNPVVMACMYFLVVSPAAVMMRRFGRRPLHLEWDPGASTYWTEHRRDEVAGASMKQQF